MNIKELVMMLIWLALVGLLFILKNGPNYFQELEPDLANGQPQTAISKDHKPLEQPLDNTLEETIRAQVQIPNWLPENKQLNEQNLTAHDLINFAQLAIDNDHAFFPESQNALYYLMLAQSANPDLPEINQLQTTLHARLYEAADKAAEDYDAERLTALTARLKSLAPEDDKIAQYTDKISTIFTLQRITNEAGELLKNNDLYAFNHQDAIHKFQQAQKLDPEYPGLIELQNQLLATISQQAIRASEEGDFEVAEAQLRTLEQLGKKHPLYTQTVALVDKQKQQRFNYLDRQFYLAIKSLQLSRAEELFEKLSQLKLDQNLLYPYQQQLKQAQIYGAYAVFDVFQDDLQQGQQSPAMVVMPVGNFFMGHAGGPKYQQPTHWVNFSKAFAVAQHEITVEQFAQFISATGYKTTAEQLNRSVIYDPRTGRFKNKHGIYWRHDYLGKRADINLPVIHVSWADANAYASWLAEQTGEPYRLLSESEFEYVLKAGSQELFPWGVSPPPENYDNLSGSEDRLRGSRVRWREGVDSYGDGYWGPAPAKQFSPNPFGLYDLSGNVMEWVEDCWHDSYFRAPDDGSAWVNKGCEKRVIRGGHWASAIDEYHSSHRKQAETTLTDPRLGFRVAKTLGF
ncbi:formylglycine-generating enzyme family protein [Marinicella gelatinilytica]|uniref:formylglycine-generating enzyme family protein n=1 Tax=Marinicella gelatinilytica TaxID=2996017 RepID=UPI002260FD2E|nr:formylglycine-generating enzyme family protein [Marinicella gelatinilytica]MCX7546079.1 SUMF1/EgtB/PvdO family nonheme iron enzyme [Marinicella gelatinilytica]